MAPSPHPRRTFLEIDADSPYSIQNLPYGVFRLKDGDSTHIGTAIGDQVLDLTLLEVHGLFKETEIAGKRVFDTGSLNAFMALGVSAWRSVRSRLQELLDADTPTLRDNADLRAEVLVPQSDVEMLLPATIGDYTDFYSSRHHAFNVGTMFRGPEKALMPNYDHLPVAYHGRSSSIVVSGRDIRRPMGQTMPSGGNGPVFCPSRQFDFELEVGFFVGPGNELGQPVTIENAADHIFGFVLVNDWSARDIQRWEYQPLGPFNSKNFATSISPWVVTMDALKPFRVQAPKQDPAPLLYLREQDRWTLDIDLDIDLQAPDMDEPMRIARSNYRYLYWTPAQQLTHHTVTGCNLRPGDLLASGTISGPDKQSRGSMLELTWRGQEPIALPDGQKRSFLRDGDRVTITGWCRGKDCRIGFGEVSARLLPAIDQDNL